MVRVHSINSFVSGGTFARSFLHSFIDIYISYAMQDVDKCLAHFSAYQRSIYTATECTSCTCVKRKQITHYYYLSSTHIEYCYFSDYLLLYTESWYIKHISFASSTSNIGGSMNNDRENGNFSMHLFAKFIGNDTKKLFRDSINIDIFNIHKHTSPKHILFVRCSMQHAGFSVYSKWLNLIISEICVCKTYCFIHLRR